MSVNQEPTAANKNAQRTANVVRLLEAFPPLDQVTRPTVPTDAAAYYLNRRPQTLRAWACLENGPLRPVRICGRLHWEVLQIKGLLMGHEH